MHVEVKGRVWLSGLLLCLYCKDSWCKSPAGGFDFIVEPLSTALYHNCSKDCLTLLSELYIAVGESISLINLLCTLFLTDFHCQCHRTKPKMLLIIGAFPLPPRIESYYYHTANWWFAIAKYASCTQTYQTNFLYTQALPCLPTGLEV